jgi:8-oxo-dGTP pyrophosphatase MutT (NUDIX family)
MVEPVNASAGVRPPDPPHLALPADADRRPARLAAALRRPLPGLPVQMGMAPQPRPGSERILDPGLDCRRAGVLVLLYPCAAPLDQLKTLPSDPSTGSGLWSRETSADDLCLVLTRRTDAVDNHRGQISFPGGRMEPGEDHATAALREGWEELAIDPAAVEVLGALSPLYIPHSGFCIYPTVAYTSARPAFVPNAAEVAEVLEARLAHLLNPATRCEETWEIRGAAARVPFYAVGPHKVWGATAMVLCELLALLRNADEDSAPAGPTGPARLAAAYDPRC